MIIDTHMHLGEIIGYCNYPFNIEKQIQVMDEVGILYGFSAHNIAIGADDFEYAEEEVAKAYEMSGGRIMAFHFFDPRETDRSLYFMEKHKKDPAYIGIKFHPSMSYTDAADERYRPSWEFAKENKLPIMSHTWDLSLTNFKQKYSHPTAFVKYLEEYPEVPFIMGHSGGRYNGVRAAVEVGKRFPQVYFDLAGDLVAAGLAKYLVDNVGDRRIFYASDYCMMDPRTTIGTVLGADIPMETKERIFWDNAAEVFGLSEK
ncbi:MAG: amidohydrolase family protein [Oscillospiraceae bacterium]|nr:amidohydrolase family protein [Oscillospiraceae bacterium]